MNELEALRWCAEKCARVEWQSSGVVVSPRPSVVAVGPTFVQAVETAAAKLIADKLANEDA